MVIVSLASAPCNKYNDTLNFRQQPQIDTLKYHERIGIKRRLWRKRRFPWCSNGQRVAALKDVSTGQSTNTPVVERDVVYSWKYYKIVTKSKPK